MSREFLCGTWQISECFLNDRVVERLGLEGIKFRLDDMGDITWYNDLSHLTAATGPQDLEDISDSADVLFSCETYEVLPATTVHGPELLFVAFAGYSIEFKVDTLQPDTHLALHCDDWYTLQCVRVAPAVEPNASGHDGPFTLLSALDNAAALFADCTIDSADGRSFHVHSTILRLSGFDASSCLTQTIQQQQQQQQQQQTANENCDAVSRHCTVGRDGGGAAAAPTDITIAIIPPCDRQTTTATTGTDQRQQQHPEPTQQQQSRLSTKAFLLSPKLLISPTLEMFHLPSKLASNLSNSFNCLAAATTITTITTSPKCPAAATAATQPPHPATDAASLTTTMPPHTLLRTNISTSDSNIKSSVVTASLSPNRTASRPNIFTFADFAGRQPRVCPPLSPYRSKSPLWSSGGSATDALSPLPPPLSPLTPVQVLQSLPADDLAAVLQWLYAECLPAGLDERRLERLVDFADGVSRLGKMSEMAAAYLALVRLRKLVMSVLADVHDCLDRIIELLHPHSVPHSPLALWTRCQCAGRELAVAAAKVVQFSNIFVRDRSRLTRQHRHEIIKCVRSRVPIFLAQALQLLQHVRAVLTSLTERERDALVAFLVPEVGRTLRLLCDIVAQLKQSLRSMYDQLKSECRAEHRRTTSGVGDVDGVDFAVRKSGRTVSPVQCSAQIDIRAARSLRFVLYAYELKRMRDVYGRISAALEIVDEKRDAFDQMTVTNQGQTIRQNLEQLVTLLPVLMERIEYCAGNLESFNGWKEFKFFFKLATNQINGVVAKLLDHQNALNDTMSHVLMVVGRPAFGSVLLELGLLDAGCVAAVNRTTAKTTMADARLTSNLRTPTSATAQRAKLNLTQHCCDPPRQSVSTLAKNALRLLHSGQHSDMEFEIVVVPLPAHNDEDDDDDGENNDANDRNTNPTPLPSVQVHIFRAHRVIVASRCEWFHKALSSGMQESIHRRITIRDTSPVIFRRLLLHLYGAPVDKTVGAEQLCELMLLADRFSVDALKDICECTLRALIDDSSVLCLLALADRLFATSLKANCFAYISQHADVVRAEVFKDLPHSVQAEVHELLLWCGRIPEPWRERKPSKKRSHKSSPRSAT